MDHKTLISVGSWAVRQKRVTNKVLRDHFGLTEEEADDVYDHLKVIGIVGSMGYVEEPQEDKQRICDAFVGVLQLTRDLFDVMSLEYDPEEETVTATFTSGYTKTANVACDSGVTMIKDIVKQIS